MLEHLARLGYASKAVIYATIGLLAILTLAGIGGAVTDTQGALRAVLTQPFGRALLLVLAVGLCGYAAWRLLDSVLDPDRDGTTASGLITRGGNFARGLIYGALGIEAIRLLRGLRGSNGDPAELLAVRVLDLPFGAVIVTIAGAVIAAYGVHEILYGVRGPRDLKIDWTPLRRDMRRRLQRTCRFGVATRGGILVTLGIFLIRAAINHDPDDAAGVRESMLVLGGLIEGRWLLAVIAVGMLAYAVDQAVRARYRRIRPVV